MNASTNLFATALYRGDTWLRCLTITDAASGSTSIVGNPINITGWYFWITIKKSVNDSDGQALFQKKFIVGDDVRDKPVQGIVWIEIPPTVTDSIPVGKYVYDLQIVMADGQVKTVDFGNLVVKSDVTRNR